jgi:hypothetical protein
VNNLRKAGLDVPEADNLERWSELQREKPRESSHEFTEAAPNPFAMDASEFGA